MTLSTGRSFRDLVLDNFLPTPAKEPREVPYWDDPVGWARDCIMWSGHGLTFYQAEIMAELIEHGREAVVSVRGAGKTTAAAILVLWYSLTREAAGVDWKIITTASHWQQLSRFLWPEIHRWADRIDWRKIDRGPFNPRSELLDLNIKLRHGQAFAIASDKPASMEGAHAAHLFLVVDEAREVPDGTWDAMEGYFSTASTVAHALAISTPGDPIGRFYDIHARAPGTDMWNPKRVDLADTVKAGQVSAKWAEDQKHLWGESSAIYQQQVLAKFVSSDSDGVIPLAWIEAAMDRWREMFGEGDYRDPAHGTPIVLADGDPVDALGVDVGGGTGGDRSTIAFRTGNVVTEVQRFPGVEPVDLAEVVMAHQEAHPKTTAGRIMASGYPKAIVDAIGLGSALKTIQRSHRPYEAFVAGEATKLKDLSGKFGFLNKRALAWWNLREMLSPSWTGEFVALPPDDTLKGDLVAPKYREITGGRIQVEKKEDIRKRIGRSTDDGDAVVMVMLDRGEGSGWVTFLERQIARQDNPYAEEDEMREHIPRVTPLSESELAILTDNEKRRRRANRPTRVPRHDHIYVLIGDERRCTTCRQKPPWTEPE